MCRISSSFARIAPKIFIRFVTVCPPRCAAPFAACCYSRRRLPLFLFSHGAFPPHHSRFLRPHRPHYINPPHMPHGAALRPIRRESAFLCARTVYSDTHASFGCACPVRTLLSGAHAANCRTEFAAVRRISHIRYTRLMPPKADVQIAASKTQPTLCPRRQNRASRACSRFQTKLRPCRKRAKTRREIVPNKIKATPQAEPKLHRQNHADRKVTAGQKVTADKPDALACIRQAHLKAPSRPPLPRQGRAQDSFRTPLLSHPGFHPRTRL